jgi:hypothetical protein
MCDGLGLGRRSWILHSTLAGKLAKEATKRYTAIAFMPYSNVSAFLFFQFKNARALEPLSTFCLKAPLHFAVESAVI